MRDFILALLIKASVLLGTAFALTLAWRHTAAARRHLIWALALGAVAVLPIAQWLGPSWPVLPKLVTTHAEPVPVPSAVPVHPLAPPIDELRSPTRREAGSSIGVMAPSEPARPASYQPAAWLFGLWLAGATVVLVAFGVGRWRVARLAARARPLAAGSWQALFDAVRAQLGLRRPVVLLTVSGPAMPMTWGVRHPVVLLPAEAELWSESRRRDVLLHELAHVERRDCLTQLLAVIACAAYWFHPLVWLAAARLRVERERACDDRVLAAGARPSEYAEHLLEIARTLRAQPATALASLAMARPSHLATRLLDVLEPARRRDALTRRLAWPASMAAALVVMPLAALRPSIDAPAIVVNAAAEGHSPTDVAVTRAVAKSGAGSAAVIAHLTRQVQDSAACQFLPPKVVNWQTVHQDDRKTVVRSTIGRCVLELRATEHFKLSADFTDVAEIDRGGLVVLEQTGGNVDRRVEMRTGGNGIDHRWFVANTERPYDADARAWLAATLTDLLRRTGYEAEARSRWILATRGVEGEFQEIALLSGTYAKRIYYQALLADGHLDETNVARVVRQAADEMNGDYDLAELLVTVAARYPITEPMRESFVTAANHIGSDYDRHRVLAVVLAGRDLPDDLATAVLGSADGIQSDYDLAEVLIVLIEKHPISEGMSEAFFKAVNGIDSDYDRHRVLSSLLGQRRAPSPSMVAAALRSAASISSNYDRAEVLVQAADAYPLDDAIRAPFFAAADDIDSDFDHGRVLKAVIQHANVAAATVAGVIASARHIGSDYDRAEVLVSVAEHARLSDELRRAFVEAARGIGSEYDRNRALAALGGNAQLD